MKMISKAYLALGLCGLMLLIGFFFLIGHASAYPTAYSGVQYTISEFVFTDDYVPITVDSCNVSIWYPNNTALILNQSMGHTGNWNYYNVTLVSPLGLYHALIRCSYGGDYGAIEKSFYLNSSSPIALFQSFLNCFGTHEWSFGLGGYSVWANVTGNASSGGGNASLVVHNPNPGNGTHQTEATGFGVGGNYLKKDSSGLTTSLDIRMKNFSIVSPVMPYISEAGSLGSGDDEFSYPRGVCTYNGTYIFVTDTINNRVVKRWGSNLTYIMQAGSFGSGDNEFSYPYYSCTDGTYLWTDDTGNSRVVKRWASNLTYIMQNGTEGTGDNQLFFPRGICTDGTYLWISDTNNNRFVKWYASNLSFISKVGSSGTGNDQFTFPFSSCTDGTYLWIVDSGNNRVVKRWAGNLSFISKIGSLGSGDDMFNGPCGLSYNNSFLYVADSNNDRIMKRSSIDLSFIASVGSAGTGNDQFNCTQGICTNGSFLWVVDTFNSRIMKRSTDIDYSHCLNVSWFSNSSGAWLEYAHSIFVSNGTVTVPFPNASGVGTYYWKAETESNHSVWFNTSVFEFTTVNTTSGIIAIPYDDITIKSSIPIVLGSSMIGFFFIRRRKRKDENRK